MRPVLTPEEMGACDRAAVAAGTPVEVLMDRAGRAVAWEARRLLDGCYGARAVIVCGKGNNGGDGLVAARVLAGWGVRTAVFELASAFDERAFARSCARADLLVDAMYGTGFHGELDGPARLVAERARDLRTLAVDIPSGIDGGTGKASGPAVVAAATVTFAAEKPGLLFEPGRTHAGAVRVADIGVAVGTPGLGVLEEADVAGWLPVRAPDAHKWRSGLLVVGGSSGMTGAPMLVSRAALRAGAGIVWCAVPGGDAAAAASGTEVITKALPAGPTGSLDAAPTGLGLERFRAAVVGPGLGTDAATMRAVRTFCETFTAPLVLDADGLAAYAGAAADLATARGGAPTVLTPHAGEHERVTGRPLGDDRVAAARGLAAEARAVVLLKGPGTVVAAPDGRAAVSPTGGPELATAGTGDVLAGLVGALLAQGLPAFEAAAAGAYVHGWIGSHAGHTDLVAGDLVAGLPDAFARLRKRLRERGNLMSDETAITEVMTRDVVTLAPDTALDAAADVFADHRIGAAPVVDAEGTLVGLLRDEDLILKEARVHVPTAMSFLGTEFYLPNELKKWDRELRQAAAATVADVMATEIETVGLDGTVEDVATLMHDKHATHVCVVDESGALVGIVARGDVVRFLARTT